MTRHRSDIRTLAFARLGVIWGVGLLMDAMLRVVFAYALPVDLVPALSAALFPVTVIARSLIDQINYRANGLRQLILARPQEAAA